MTVLVGQVAPFGAAETGDSADGSDTSGYVVTFKPGTGAGEQRESRDDVTDAGGEVHRTYTRAVQGFAADLPPESVAGLRADPDVRSVTPDVTFRANGGVQNPAPWNLDRIDQRQPAPNGAFSYEADGTGITVYVLDTGIRADHGEFGGRVGSGFTAFDDGNGTYDCAGHGTHVAGTIGSSTYGVAKGVTLVPVRVLGCDGVGGGDELLAGLDWVIAHHVPGRSVINMSLGGAAASFIDEAVANAVSFGIPVVVAAGNDGSNACNFSPARAPSAVTVGAVDAADRRPSFSNFGACVDVFAPGVGIVAPYNASSTSLGLADGTSSASPHVAGALAVLLQGAPGAAPAALRTTLGSLFTNGGLTNIGAGSPNSMLYAPTKLRLAGVGSATTSTLLAALGADPAALAVTGEPLVEGFSTSGSTPVAVQDPATLPACSIARPTSQGQARSALLTSLGAGNGCVQFAQAESLDLSPASPRLVYVPFGRDNVTFAVSAASSLPITLTLTSLRTIYSCPEGTSFRPMLPPVGSGLREFWLTQMYPGGVPSPLPSCVQNGVDEAGTVIGVNAGLTVNNAELVPYSVTQWAGQTADIFANRRGQTRIGQVDGQSPFTPTFGLQRDLYIVFAQSALNGSSVNDLRLRSAFVGAGSFLCAAIGSPAGLRFGFRPHPNCGATGLVTP